jgi:RNA-directed DNA polymerase
MSLDGRNQLRLNIGSLDLLGYALGLSPEVIVAASQRTGHDYGPFMKVSEPAPFARNPIEFKQRRIDNPILITKEIQKRINRRLLRPLTLPGHICGGVKGKTLLDNIVPHLKARVIVTADIKSFFPTITTFQVYAIWSHLLGCSPEIARLLTRLTTFERRLPQGAPTSSTLANLVLFSYDQPIRSFCAKHGITYTTWIDDLIFSGTESRSVINVAVSALRAGGFSLPH